MKFNTRVLCATVLTGLSLAAALPSFADSPLEVGSTPPSLKVAKWLKGEPVKSFEKGKVYVVEFWATWCGPCKESIPHLTKLAKKFEGKVWFTGVSIKERDKKNPSDPYMKRVESFVKAQGPKMNYIVAADGTDDFMSKNWMDASGQGGIPTAFVIDQNQKIAWIGHPMDGLEKVLSEVLAGTFDAAAAAKQRIEQEREGKEMEAQYKGIVGLAEAGKLEEAIAKVDEMIAKYPATLAGMSAFRFSLMLKMDEPAAYKYADGLGTGVLKDDAMALNNLSWEIAQGKKPIKNPDLDVALKLATQACELTKMENSIFLDTLAYVYYKQKNLGKAIEIQELAMKFLPDSKLPAEIVKELTDRLAMYKKG